MGPVVIISVVLGHLNLIVAYSCKGRLAVTVLSLDVVGLFNNRSERQRLVSRIEYFVVCKLDLRRPNVKFYLP